MENIHEIGPLTSDEAANGHDLALGWLIKVKSGEVDHDAACVGLARDLATYLAESSSDGKMKTIAGAFSVFFDRL
jgi:hypothetical protein